MANQDATRRPTQRDATVAVALDRHGEETNEVFARRMVALLSSVADRSPDAGVRTVCTVIGQTVVALGAALDDQKRRTDALLALCTELTADLEPLRHQQLPERMAVLEGRVRLGLGPYGDPTLHPDARDPSHQPEPFNIQLGGTGLMVPRTSPPLPEAPG